MPVEEVSPPDGTGRKGVHVYWHEQIISCGTQCSLEQT